ncbi:VanZ family protein [Fibrella sp. WM1]|uniref:VanZ family protein n=1 Tax=Fibrella musci TaxID=3242485 RepID=UPI0035200E65
MQSLESMLAYLGLNGYQAVAAAVVFVAFLVMWLVAHVRWQRAAAIAWSIAIFAGLSLPTDVAPDVGGSDKNVHTIIFAGFAFLWRWAGLSERRTLAWGVAYAVLSEVYQAVMPIGRSGDWQDALADMIGLLIGLLLARLLAKVITVPARKD